MPIYEYRCLDCKQRSSILLLSRSPSSPPLCTHCRSGRLERLLSRFSAPKSEEARIASLADDDTLSGLDDTDPASMERLMKRMGDEMGEDVSDEMSQALDSPEETGSGVDDSDVY